MQKTYTKKYLLNFHFSQTLKKLKKLLFTIDKKSMLPNTDAGNMDILKLCGYNANFIFNSFCLLSSEHKHLLQRQP